MNTTRRESRKGIVSAAPLLTFTFAIFLAALPGPSIAADPETKEHKPVIVQLGVAMVRQSGFAGRSEGKHSVWRHKESRTHRIPSQASRRRYDRTAHAPCG